MVFRDWRLWVALALIAFWVWRVIVMRVEIGLVMFATSAGLLVAVFLIISAWVRARRDSGRA